ncbi:hypothetical protein JTB14_024338 [Gonioctena quinquepunctata]|nr:hypothetical protein JTB14_024338 [Gonioctena quinquepunctata]
MDKTHPLSQEKADTVPQFLSTLEVAAARVVYPLEFTICNIYLPDANWNIADLINVADQLPPPYVIVGDFNAHNPIWGSTRIDTRGRIVENFIDDMNLVILNSGEGTYLNLRSNSLSVIDLAFCSPTLAPSIQWKCLGDHLTDHFPISIEFASRYITQSIPRKWKLDQANWPLYKENIIQIQTPMDDVDTSTRFISDKIIDAAKIAVPQTSGRKGKKTTPWWNAEIARLIREKHRALNIMKRFPTLENTIAFKKARARAKRSLHESKRRSWEEYVSTITASTPPSEVWKKIRAILGKKFTETTLALEIDGEIFVDQTDIAEKIAQHFEMTSSSQHLGENDFINRRNLERNIDFHEQNISEYNESFSMMELEHALDEAGSSSPGADNIVYDFVRQLPTTAKEVLLDIFNKIWSSGIYPQAWRQAIVIPILKSGKDPRTPNSYRPISLTSCLSKIMEKMVSYRLRWVLESKQLLSTAQAGFRCHRSTIDQLVLLEKEIQNSFAERNHLVAVFFDLERAFDSTWRFGVLEQMNEWGLRGNLPIFIKSFPRYREFQVRNGSYYSQPYILENGVPQGSTLSVLIFAIAINSIIEDLNPDIGRCLYVDDLTIYYSAASMTVIENTLQMAIDTLSQKAEHLGWKFSVTKTSCVHFCRLRSPHIDPKLKLYGQNLQCEETTKFLGLIFDKKLTWGPHIEDLAQRCKKALNPLRAIASINWGCDQETLLRLYKSLILSKMDYGCFVYGSARPSRMKILDSIQCNALRIALGAYRTSPYLALCCDAGITPLKYRRYQLLTAYSARIWAHCNHPIHPMEPNQDEYEIYERRPTITRPAGVRLKELLTSLHYTFPRVYDINQFENTPWKTDPPSINVELLKYKKGDTNSIIILMEFYRIIDCNPGCQIIYTDGSKTERVTKGLQEMKWLTGQLEWPLHKETLKIFHLDPTT